MGYAGHVPLLFGGTKQTTGVAPSLLNGSDLDGLDSQPSVNVSHPHHFHLHILSNHKVSRLCVQFELSMRMGCHSARSSREEWRRRRSPKIEHDLESRSYSGEYFDRL